MISNGKQLLIKNKRYSLEKSKVFNSSTSNEHLWKFFGKPKYFNLKISPVEISDSGWYSCYVVKQQSNEQNIKYFTYLNVKNNVKVAANLDASFQYHPKKIETSEIISQAFVTEGQKNGLMKPAETIFYRNDLSIKKRPDKFVLDSSNEHSYFVSTVIFDREKQSLINLDSIEE